MSSWKQMASIEHLEGLNGLDVGSPKFKEYVKIINELAGSRDPKKLKRSRIFTVSIGNKARGRNYVESLPCAPKPTGSQIRK